MRDKIEMSENPLFKGLERHWCHIWGIVSRPREASNRLKAVSSRSYPFEKDVFWMAVIRFQQSAFSEKTVKTMVLLTADRWWLHPEIHISGYKLKSSAEGEGFSPIPRVGQ
jgi:hypothetical protein